MKYFNYKQKNNGFTLIELLVSSAIFLVVVLMGTGVILTIEKSRKVTAFTREQVDVLSSIMEDMVRNMRVGSVVHCGTSSLNIDEPASCYDPNDTSELQQSLKIAFEGFNGDPLIESDQIVYEINALSGGDTIIAKSVAGDPLDINLAPYQRLTPSSIVMDLNKSGFTVIGAEKNDGLQPLILIRLSGFVHYQDVDTPFSLQTSVTLRAPDF